MDLLSTDPDGMHALNVVNSKQARLEVLDAHLEVSEVLVELAARGRLEVALVVLR